MPKYQKKITLRLSDDHPIFNYPDGIRAQIAREWLDIGARLARIENMIENQCSEPSVTVPATPPATPKINTERLMKRIDEMF